MRFIVGERRTGKTRALVEAAIEADGVVVVGLASRRDQLLHDFPALRGRVFSIGAGRISALRGSARPIFVDGLGDVLTACGVPVWLVDGVTVEAETLEPGIVTSFPG